MSYESDLHSALKGHLCDSWPDRQQSDLRWELGPVEEALPGFVVRKIEPIGPESSYLYLSVGASKAYSDELREFFIESPTDSVQHVETLAMVAHFHSFPAHRLAHGAVVDLGRPWIAGSKNRHLFVSWPYALDPRVATCFFEGKEIIYLWLIPISAEEASLVEAGESDLLEARLEESGVNLLDPRRPSVV